MFIGNAFDFKPETLFDAVLLDAPCSSTGTIRRHPDVAWTKSPQDVEKLAKLQFEMELNDPSRRRSFHPEKVLPDCRTTNWACCRAV